MMLSALHVGCGPASLPDHVFPPSVWRETRLDIDPAVAPDVVASIVDLPFSSGAYAAVYSSHNLEHLAPHEVPQALAEFFRVLMPNGFAMVSVPDMGLAAARIAEGRGDAARLPRWTWCSGTPVCGETIRSWPIGRGSRRRRCVPRWKRPAFVWPTWTPATTR